MTLVARQTLLELRDLQQVPDVDEPRELADERDVFRDVAAELAEFGVFIDETASVERSTLRQTGQLRTLRRRRRARTHRFMSATVSILLAAELADRVE